MRAEEELLEAVARGHRLLEDERAELLAGRLAGLGDLAAAKGELLETLEATIPRCPGTPAARHALTRLIEESRRNERLIAAAISGVGAAHRRIAAISATRRGDVAYAADGSRIVSRADAASRSSQA